MILESTRIYSRLDSFHFPASLYRFQIQRNSGLFAYKENGDFEDGLEVSERGLVHLRISSEVLVSALFRM